MSVIQNIPNPDFTKVPETLLRELIELHNPRLIGKAYVVTDVVAIEEPGFNTAALVRPATVGNYAPRPVRIRYNRVDIATLFSKVGIDITAIREDGLSPGRIMEEIRRKYSVWFPAGEMELTEVDGVKHITAKADSYVYINSMNLTEQPWLRDRVLMTVLEGFEIPAADLEDIITVDTLPIWVMPEGYVDGKLYATTYTHSRDYNTLVGSLTLDANNYLVNEDEIAGYFEANEEISLPLGLRYLREPYANEYGTDGYTHTLTSELFETAEASGRIIIRCL